MLAVLKDVANLTRDFLQCFLMFLINHININLYFMGHFVLAGIFTFIYCRRVLVVTNDFPVCNQFSNAGTCIFFWNNSLYGCVVLFPYQISYSNCNFPQVCYRIPSQVHNLSNSSTSKLLNNALNTWRHQLKLEP